ncbi:hypothetical protein CYMTET_31811 [Cymbomonas tetramitiformis]|uniref:Uncharacterized protein n=1 Tax=Cymbomonas tetramitiformis TaxID=36881 RepID=A0AAE0FG22_9CHLO|nr:hypothetical protein CYMTET_41430 [Cymbomonas tetramitiformis]KAK3259151.1 hypothetical protein CYMTET_31811 [Cymbomonas tetramitiformis]
MLLRCHEQLTETSPAFSHDQNGTYRLVSTLYALYNGFCGQCDNMLRGATDHLFREAVHRLPYVRIGLTVLLMNYAKPLLASALDERDACFVSKVNNLTTDLRLLAERPEFSMLNKEVNDTYVHRDDPARELFERHPLFSNLITAPSLPSPWIGFRLFCAQRLVFWTDFFLLKGYVKLVTSDSTADGYDFAPPGRQQKSKWSDLLNLNNNRFVCSARVRHNIDFNFVLFVRSMRCSVLQSLTIPQVKKAAREALGRELRDASLELSIVSDIFYVLADEYHVRAHARVVADVRSALGSVFRSDTSDEQIAELSERFERDFGFFMHIDTDMLTMCVNKELYVNLQGDFERHKNITMYLAKHSTHEDTGDTLFHGPGFISTDLLAGHFLRMRKVELMNSIEEVLVSRGMQCVSKITDREQVEYASYNTFLSLLAKVDRSLVGIVKFERGECTVADERKRPHESIVADRQTHPESDLCAGSDESSKSARYAASAS